MIYTYQNRLIQLASAHSCHGCKINLWGMTIKVSSTKSSFFFCSQAEAEVITLIVSDSFIKKYVLDLFVVIFVTRNTRTTQVLL